MTPGKTDEFVVCDEVPHFLISEVHQHRQVAEGIQKQGPANVREHLPRLGGDGGDDHVVADFGEFGQDRGFQNQEGFHQTFAVMSDPSAIVDSGVAGFPNNFEEPLRMLPMIGDSGRYQRHEDGFVFSEAIQGLLPAGLPDVLKNRRCFVKAFRVAQQRGPRIPHPVEQIDPRRLRRAGKLQKQI